MLIKKSVKSQIRCKCRYETVSALTDFFVHRIPLDSVRVLEKSSWSSFRAFRWKVVCALGGFFAIDVAISITV